ncbi:MAG TPA: 4Fe-4S binding protein [Prolixibacteraceae bacterium]|nr:4Fe-4S binding protein [Prolixibacteraceae bacterium]
MMKIKSERYSLQKLRFGVQLAFALLCIWIGVEFYYFVRYFETGGQIAFHSRPAGVDGFLPISSLMSLVYFLKTGIIHLVHPAGFYILISILLMSLVFKKSFCSWLCIVGTLSEKLGDLGEFIFRKKIRMPKVADSVLRGIKYLLLAFFVFIIFRMTAFELKSFLDGDFNIVADVKMYDFFAQISNVSLIVISVLVILSVFFRGFWCRYLCPYGALLGLVGLLSPNKIRRNEESCISCGKCSKVCPSFIKVDQIRTVHSDECSSCMRCIDSCPVKNTLVIKPILTNKPISKNWVAAAVIIIFLGVTAIGMLSGKWQNSISKEKYMELYQHRNEIKHR